MITGCSSFRAAYTRGRRSSVASACRTHAGTSCAARSSTRSVSRTAGCAGPRGRHRQQRLGDDPVLPDQADATAQGGARLLRPRPQAGRAPALGRLHPPPGPGRNRVGARARLPLPAGVAQLVEHQLPKLRVAGSSPVPRFEKAPETGLSVFLGLEGDRPILIVPDGVDANGNPRGVVDTSGNSFPYDLTCIIST